ncbi:MAG: GNAT family N-acetyltransferase [Acidimicrobiia bacterium]
MDSRDEARLGHLNLVEFSREQARWAQHHAVHDENGVCCFAGDSDWPAYNNGVLRYDDATPGTAVIAQANAFFNPRRRGFSLWARDQAADTDLYRAIAAAGYGAMFTYPQLICRAPLPDGPTSGDTDIRVVVDAAGVADFAEVNAAAYTSYGAPAEATRSNFGRSHRFLEPSNHAVVGYVEGAPVAAAMILGSHEIAGVYWVGTVEAARGRGLAEACTRAVTNLGFQLGAHNIQLQASPMGEPIYRRMGYEELYRYTFFLAPPPA